jgi:hypothetical protein
VRLLWTLKSEGRQVKEEPGLVEERAIFFLFLFFFYVTTGWLRN